MRARRLGTKRDARRNRVSKRHCWGWVFLCGTARARGQECYYEEVSKELRAEWRVFREQRRVPSGQLAHFLLHPTTLMQNYPKLIKNFAGPSPPSSHFATLVAKEVFWRTLNSSREYQCHGNWIEISLICIQYERIFSYSIKLIKCHEYSQISFLHLCAILLPQPCEKNRSKISILLEKTKQWNARFAKIVQRAQYLVSYFHSGIRYCLLEIGAGGKRLEFQRSSPMMNFPHGYALLGERAAAESCLTPVWCIFHNVLFMSSYLGVLKFAECMSMAERDRHSKKHLCSPYYKRGANS